MMSCTWHTFTNIADHFYMPVLLVAATALIATALWRALKLRAVRTGGSAHPAAFPFVWPRSFTIAVAVTFIALGLYPLMSSTFCENIKCRGMATLAPKTTCKA